MSERYCWYLVACRDGRGADGALIPWGNHYWTRLAHGSSDDCGSEVVPNVNLGWDRKVIDKGEMGGGRR